MSAGYEKHPGFKRSTFSGSAFPPALELELPTGKVMARRADDHTLAILPGTGFTVFITRVGEQTFYVPKNAADCRLLAEQLLLASDYLETDELAKSAAGSQSPTASRRSAP